MHAKLNCVRFRSNSIWRSANLGFFALLRCPGLHLSMATGKYLVPLWAIYWFGFNLFLLPYDAVYILFGPFTSSGRLVRLMFAGLDFYAEHDVVFSSADKTVFAIYIVGVADIIAQLAIFVTLKRRPFMASNPAFAMCIVAELAVLGTKTAVYLLYGTPFMRGPLATILLIVLLNSMWVIVPALLIAAIVRRSATKTR